MRLILVALVIIYHSFAPFCGSWDPIGSGEPIKTYFYIGKISYSFFLEAFVFISGILVGFQSLKRPVKEQGFKFITKKIKRLILPSVIFSIIYYFCFYSYSGIYNGIIAIINGCGHLWFLPMLFWCFVFLWLIERISINKITVLIIASVISLFSNNTLPVRIGVTMYYFIFFLLGYYYPTGALNKIINPSIRNILIYLVLFCCLFPLSITSYSDSISGVILTHLIRLISSFSGVMFMYCLVLRLTPDKKPLPPLLVTLSTYSFGIYIVQQFILKYLYYHTSLPLTVDYLLLPFIGTFVALILSLIITHISLKTFLGKFLIG